MTEKPKINPPLTGIDIILEAIAAISLIYMIAQLITEYPNLEDQVPTHYGLDGTPDAWGQKSSMLILPVIAIILFTGMTFLNRFPYIFNYPVEITKANASRQYQLAKSLISYLKTFIVGLFLYIQINTTNISQDIGIGLGTTIVFFVGLGTVAPIIVYLILASRQK